MSAATALSHVGRTAPLAIGDGADWHFTNAAWADAAEDELAVPEEVFIQDGPAMQGVHFAFHRQLCYHDGTVNFQFRLGPHSDTGIVFRAGDASHFHVLHFPCCGQACRAQHFWVALSKMDESGYLRIEKLQMLNRVPSTVGKWLDASVRLEGSSLSVRVGDYGRFEAELAGDARAGHVGVYRFGAARIRKVTVAGAPAAPVWNDGPRQRRSWTYPVPVEPERWQQPGDLKQLPDGRLILLFNVAANDDQSENARATAHLVWSSDAGRTWSDPKPLAIAGDTPAWAGIRLHVTPRGRLIAVQHEKPGGSISESSDGGRTWSTPTPTNLPFDRYQLSPHGLLNLADGAILAFVLGRFGQAVSPNIWTWGSVHCQAFACRSEDDGRTWSEPVNLDTPLIGDDGQAVAGNLDLTEPSAVQLAGGRVMALIRPVYSPWMWETWSDDGGRSWSACVRGPFAGYAAPNMVRTRSGALVVAHRLPGLTVHCSHDGGDTWDQGTMIDSGLWAMGSLAEVEPDVVLYVYWDSFSRRMRSQCFAVTPSGLQPRSG